MFPPNGMWRVWGYAYERPPVKAAPPVPSKLVLEVAPGATIDVFLPGTTTPVALYADSRGTTPLANPFVADDNAYFFFYTPHWSVDVRISPTLPLGPYTLGDVPATVMLPFVVVDAVGDGSHDDTAAIQAALDLCDPALGIEVLLPPGQYRITSPLVIECDNVYFHGAGSLGSANIFSLDETQDLLQIKAATGVTIEDIRFVRGSLTPTAGAGIRVAADPGRPGVEPFSFLCRRCYFQTLWDAIVISAGYFYGIEDCLFANTVNAGVTLSNTVNPDNGDGWITGNSFVASNTEGISAAILHHSGGGLRVQNNKVLGHKHAYWLYLPSDFTIQTPGLMMIGNSFEGSLDSPVLLERDPANVSFGAYNRVVIMGNQIDGNAVPGTYSIRIAENVFPFVNEFVIANNLLHVYADTGGILIGAGNLGIIEGNQIYSEGGNAVGFQAGPLAQQLTLGVNQYFGAYAAAHVVILQNTLTNMQPSAVSFLEVWDPGTIAAGASVQHFTTLPNYGPDGPHQGDVALATHGGLAAIPTPVSINADVIAENVIRTVITNNGGGPITIASNNLRVTAFRYYENLLAV